MAIGTVRATRVPERLIVPLYSYAEADRLARVRPGTSKRWSRGYSYQSAAGESVRKPPVGKTAPSPRAAVSFADLVEVAAIRGLRDLGVSLPQIRRVVESCRELFDSERPLLTHRFKTDRKEVFVQSDAEVLVSVLRGKRLTAWDDVLGPFLDTVDYRDGWARRWWPEGQTKQVLIDPDFGFGLPVVAGTGVRTEILFERGEVGESVEEIAADFGIPVESVEDALQFERAVA